MNVYSDINRIHTRMRIGSVRTFPFDRDFKSINRIHHCAFIIIHKKSDRHLSRRYMIRKRCIYLGILKDSVFNHILTSLKGLFRRLEHEFHCSFQLTFLFFQNPCRTQKHCRMKIMSTSMCCFSCWTGKCFTAFLRHRKSIHICTQEKNLTAISKHCRNSLSAFNRIQTILFQLIHHISFRLRKFKSCLCILMNVSSVCYCLVF